MKVDVFLCKDNADCFCCKTVKTRKQCKRSRVVKLPVKLRSDDREYDDADVFYKMTKLCQDSDSVVVESSADEEKCSCEAEMNCDSQQGSEADAVNDNNDSENFSEQDSDLLQQDSIEQSFKNACEAFADNNADLPSGNRVADDYDSDEAELLAMIEEELREKKQSKK